ncbi:ABC-2 type transport system permease protein [Streptomyces zhaozhouensis]|uniref:ABC-2 type transport system permease protein n=1 Tax=Streptomyces zhaozhouensis TaxID=1300267 RepID=A0A286EAS7_9ACTN|nr:ABC-2 family transporter protein [Streptomyces zhaozhouensis]SOD67998.1 ABC-2 type transport system permease protein [Streptomyces zhaozhouensis]
MGSWTLYRSVAGYGFRRYATYRLATAAGVFTNTVFGLILAHAFMALWHERPQLGGYEQAQALTFVWVGQALLASVALMGGGFESELQQRIRTGDVAIDLYRPADLQLWWLATDLGRAAFQLLGRGVVPLAVGALVFDLALPLSPRVWASFLVSVVLAVVISFAMRFLVALSTFWMMDGVGASTVNTVVSMFFSGMLLPLTVFPGALGEVVRWLPWAGMLQIPADVLLERRVGWGLVAGLALQLGWALAALAVGRWLQSVATRRVVVQGG